MLVPQGENRHVFRLPFYVLGLGTVTRAWRRHSVTIHRKEGRRNTCLKIKVQFLWLKRGRKQTEVVCSQPPSCLKAYWQAFQPQNMGERKPQAWPAQKRCFIHKRTQLLPSFTDWFPCLRYSLEKSWGLSEFLISPGQAICCSTCGL